MTIWMLYTAAALVLALALIYRLFRCAHAWELVDKTEFCSQMEELEKHGYNYSVCKGDGITEATKRSATIVMRCPRCGAAKVIRVES
jgi:predicted RNA-binding Zn-ribbon protein involved in translation (DUF1610 family)